MGNRGFNAETWTHPRDFGNANNMYIEDNTITSAVNAIIDSSRREGTWPDIIDYIHGQRISVFDMHGNMPGSLYSDPVGEIYGNSINVNSGTGHAELVNQRGAQLLCFFNNVTGAELYSQLREEYADNINGDNTDVQHVTNSYYWNNRLNGTTLEGTAIFFGTSGNATGGGSNYITVSNNNWNSSNPERYGLYITAGKGAGQWGTISAITSTQITISQTWTTIPDATSQYSITGDCCNAFCTRTSSSGTTRPPSTARWAWAPAPWQTVPLPLAAPWVSVIGQPIRTAPKCRARTLALIRPVLCWVPFTSSRPQIPGPPTIRPTRIRIRSGFRAL